MTPEIAQLAAALKHLDDDRLDVVEAALADVLGAVESEQADRIESAVAQYVAGDVISTPGGIGTVKRLHATLAQPGLVYYELDIEPDIIYAASPREVELF
jgi:hypothetical protein